MTEAIWVHPYALTVPRDLPAIFVFDDEFLKRERWSLKRVMFVYECLLELPVEIVRGDTVTEVRRFAGDRAILSVPDPDPWIQARQRELDTQPLDRPPFVDYRGKLDLKRFSRYWQRVEPVLFPK
ncbi:MAG: hypothetical protein SFV18_06600 [Bryobacteraceae bacterium]|nr:hypothetical protein [Bryobacteraceae bacterium]